MTKEEATKYLQQLYPNGGHCWLDEQRIEAIGMAIKALQEEPISKDLEEEVDRWYNNEAPKEFEDVLYADIENCAKHFVDWQKRQDQSTIELAEDHAMLTGMNKMEEQMMSKAIDAHCFGFQQGAALFTFRLPADKYLVGSEVKVIVIKED